MKRRVFVMGCICLLAAGQTKAQTFSFQDPSTRLTTIGRGDTRVANGVLTSKDNYAVLGEQGLKDYRLSFRARNPEGAEQVQIWAGFRAANRFDRYVVGIKGGLTDQVYLMRTGYMGTDEFMAERPLRFHPVPGAWYNIKVEVVGQRIRVFVGDAPLPYIDIVDKNGQATASGPVTLGGCWIETEYDDLVITPLEATALDGVSNREFEQRLTVQQKEAKRQQERVGYRPVNVSRLNGARTEVRLDGQWLFMPEYEQDDRAAAVSPDSDDRGWHVMTVPNFWNPIRIWLHGETMSSPRGAQPKGVSDRYYQQETDRCENYTFDYRRTNGAWYRQWVELPDDIKDRTLTLHFDAVSKTADVYVNGQLATTHVGMFGDFSIDVTSLMHPGRNLIAVKVMRNKDNNAEADNDALDAFYARAQGNATRTSQEADKQQKPTDILKDMPHGFFGGDPAGIWQPVKLTITGQAKVEDVFIKPELDGASFDVTLKNYQAKKGVFDLSTEIVDKKTGEVLYSGSSLTSVALNGGEQRTLSFAIDGLTPKLWTPSHPNLYDFRFRLDQQTTNRKAANRTRKALGSSKKAIDSLSITSGFRTFRVKDGFFELNGVRYWLRGGNHVPAAICPNDSLLAHKFFQLMREGNVETTRSHASPFNELWMTAADEEGIGVSFEGTWSWLMLEDRPIPNPDLLEMYETEWLGLLKKYRNHPSLLLWTVNNEMKFYDLDPDMERAKKKMVVISDLVKMMREADPTRPMVYDSNYFRKGKDEKYGKAFMDTIDDGDVDDIHAYYNWYDYSLFRFFKGEFEQWFKVPGRPLISQEMSTGYPNNETGHPTRSYQIIHQNPMTLVGYKAFDWCNPKYFLETQAFTTGELAEALRRTCPNGSGIMHFALLTWFRECYDAEKITPWPTYYALKRALQPVLVSAELWGRNLYGGEQLKTRIYVVNDREDGTALKPTVLRWQIAGEADGRVLAEGQEQIRSVAHYEHHWMEPSITLPQVGCKQKVRLLLSLTEDGREISSNEYALTLAPKTDIGLQKIRKDVRIVENADSLSEKELKALHKFVKKGGRLVLLNSKEVARQLYPEYIKGWIIPTEGDICYMEQEEDPVFDGIDPMELRYWNDNRREMPRACNATLKTVRSPQVEELAGQMKIHAYIDGGSPEDRIKRIDQMRGYTLLRIHDGKGEVIVSTMCTEKAGTDPIAAQLLSNMIK